MLRRLLKGIATTAIVGAIFLVLLEVVGRVFDPFGISYYPNTAAYLDTMIMEEPIGYRNRPNLRGEFWGAPVSINSLGLRGDEVDLEPAENEVRILLLGDSLVFGVGLSDQYTIPRQLEQQLNRTSQGVVYRVINMGVPSYNTEQELIQLRTVGLSLNPDLVLLIFTDNDLQPKMWVFDRRKSMLVNFVQRSYALSLVALLYWDLNALLTGYSDRVPYLQNRDEHPRWPVVEAALTQILDLCRERKTPFVLFSRETSPRIEAIAADLGVPFVDLQPLLDDPRWNKPGVALSVSQIDTHPNRLGGEMYSTLIREALEHLEVLPRIPTRAHSKGAEPLRPDRP